MYLNKHTSVHVGLKIVRVLGTDQVCSPYYQFLLVKKGSIVLHYDNSPEYTMHKGDIICIAPGCHYYTRPLSSNILIGLRLDPPFINALISPGHELLCNSVTDQQGDYTWLERLITDIGSAYYSSNNDNRMLALLYEMSDCLTERHIHPAADDYNTPDYVIQERIGMIRSYIETNYHQSVSLSALSELMYLTPQYVSRFIKKHMHTSFGRYLTHIRLEHACSELIHTDHSVTNIAMNTGFPNVSAFHKAFRETYGEPPGSWRSSHLLPEEASPNVQVYTADDVLPSVQRLHIEATAVPETAATSPIGDMINIGPLELAMEPAFRSSFEQCRRQTPFRYIRCYNVFSEKVIRFDEKNEEYNFTSFLKSLIIFINIILLSVLKSAINRRKIRMSCRFPGKTPHHILTKRIRITT